MKTRKSIWWALGASLAVWLATYGFLSYCPHGGYGDKTLDWWSAGQPVACKHGGGR